MGNYQRRMAERKPKPSRLELAALAKQGAPADPGAVSVTAKPKKRRKRRVSKKKAATAPK